VGYYGAMLKSEDNGENWYLFEAVLDTEEAVLYQQLTQMLKDV